MILVVLTERPRIYCLAKSLDFAVIKLTRSEIDATKDLLDLLILRNRFFGTFKSDFNSHNLSVTLFL